MIIAIDLDNTISDAPEFFSVVATALVDAGHEVHIITYREVGTHDDVRAELREFGIRYTQLHLPQSDCSAPEWKAELAVKLGVDVMIEDSPEVLSRMPSTVRRLWLCDATVFNLDTCVRALRGELVALQPNET